MDSKQIIKNMMSIDEDKKEKMKPIDRLTFKTFIKKFNETYGQLQEEQKKLSAYANMGRGGLKVVIWLGYIIAVSIGYFVGNKL